MTFDFVHKLTIAVFEITFMLFVIGLLVFVAINAVSEFVYKRRRRRREFSHDKV